LSKLAGQLLARFKQSSVTGEVLVGLILGPAIFGKYLPQYQSILFPKDAIQSTMLETVAWVGNFYLLMETGLDVNFSRIWKQKGQASIIALSDMIIPFLIVIIPAYLLPDIFLVDPSKRFIFSCFIAVTMTISALPVVVRIMHDLNILKTDTGFLIISALTLNDVVGWVIFTIILGIFGQSVFSFLSVFKLIILTIAFTVLSFTLFRKLVNQAMAFVHEKFGGDTGLKTSFIFIVGMIFGALTLQIGIHSLFGFFIAGIILGESKHFSQNDRHVINRLVHSVFVPIFFANIGLHLDIVRSFDWRLVLFFLAIGILARFTGAYVGARISGQNKSNLATIAICHTAGGEMHIIVALLALSSGLITDSIFIGIVVASILTTIIIGPWLSYNLSRKRQNLLNVLFNVDSVFLNRNYSTRSELIEGMGNEIAARLKLSPEHVLQEIQSREEQMSTALGNGVAFPHARLKDLSQPHIIFVRNDQGLDWDSMDGKPVSLVFFILTPEENPTIQLYILQTLAKALSDAGIKEILTTSRSVEDVIAVLKPGLASCEECVVPM